MHAWRVNNEVYVQTRGEDLLRQTRAERLASTCAKSRRRTANLAYVSRVVLYRVGSQLVRLGYQLQGLLPENSGDGGTRALASPVGEKLR